MEWAKSRSYPTVTPRVPSYRRSQNSWTFPGLFLDQILFSRTYNQLEVAVTRHSASHCQNIKVKLSSIHRQQQIVGLPKRIVSSKAPKKWFVSWDGLRKARLETRKKVLFVFFYGTFHNIKKIFSSLFKQK